MATGVVSVVAGTGAQGSANGPASAATFYEPDGIVLDAAGNIYIGDQGNNLIRKITPTGVVTTLAGTGAQGSANGPANGASFYSPRGLAIDLSGNIYVADQANNLIRKITPTGVVTTVGGNSFNSPTGVGIDVAGILYVADAGSNSIKKIATNGTVTTFATGLSFPREIRINNDGDCYVTNQNTNSIVKISPAGVVTPVASSGFNSPIGLVLDGLGNLYIADSGSSSVKKVVIANYTIDKSLPTGLVFDNKTGIISGTPTAPSSATNYTITAYNTTGSSSTVVNIQVNAAPVLNAAPNISYPTPQVYTVNTPITTLTPTNSGGAVPSYAYGSVGVFAGNGTAGSTDATGTAASFNAPQSIAIDATGNLYVPEYNNKIIRKITPAGVVTTYAGVLFSPGSTNGPMLSATFNGPTSVAFDSSGNMFVADYQGETIRKITPAGIVSTFAGTGILGYSDGPGTTATFNQPYGIAIDKNDNIYVAEVGNHTIRKITPAGVVTTLAGNGFAGQANGTGSSAQFSGPTYLTTDAAGNVYVSDSGNNAIRKITPGGVVTTIAGVLPGVPPALSNIGIPGGIRITAAGNIYFASLNKNQIYEITSAGSLVLIAGSGAVGSANSFGASATFNRPQDIEFDATGNLYVADQYNYLIRTVNTTGYTIDKALPAGLTFDARTGTFVGTPTVTSPPTNYTVTAYNLGGVSTTVINITVNATAVVSPPTVAPDITYTTPPIYTTNTAITPLSPTNRGGISTSYAIDKTLPAGLIFDPTTGIISGKPTATSPVISYTITASNVGGSSTKIINIEVKNPGTLTPSLITFPIPVAGVSQVGADGVLVTGVISNNTESPIIYTSSNPSIAYVGSDGLIHVLGGVSVDITASQNASTNYTAAVPITRSFVFMQREDITFANIYTKGICQPDFPAGATSSNPNIPIIYTSFDTRVATVSPSGIIHIVGSGTTRITASQAGDALHYAAISQSQSFTITAPIKPIVDVVTNNYSYCPDTPQPFSAIVSNLSLLGPNPDYQWQVNGQNVGSNSDKYTTVVSITDIIKCTVTNHHICGDIIGMGSTYNIQPLPTAKLAVHVTASKTGPICSGTFLTFTAQPNDLGVNPSYQWQVNGVSAGNNSTTFGTNNLVNGDVVTCVFTHSSMACLPNPTVTSNSVTLNIVTPANPAPTVSISPSVNHVYAGTPITFTATVLSAVATTTYQWKVNGANAGTNSPTFTSSDFANKDTVTCTIISGTCDAPAISPAVTLIILPPFVIKPPNTFTPNGDGINDLWNIIGLSDFPNCLVAVYNRYGLEVFKSTGYSKSWDGLYKANLLPTGTYYYVIDLDGKKPKVSGYVTIIR